MLQEVLFCVMLELCSIGSLLYVNMAVYATNPITEELCVLSIQHPDSHLHFLIHGA